MSAKSTGTKICPHCHEQIDDNTLVCPHCGKSADERQTPSNAFSILENNLDKRIQAEKPSESQIEEGSTHKGQYEQNSKPPDNKNSGGSGLGCFFTASLVSLAIAGISYLLSIETYDQQNPWAGIPLILLVVIFLPMAVIWGIMGIIEKITAKKDNDDD